MINEPRICVIGLGYVGLPLAVSFAQHYPVVGFDINAGRVAELQDGVDRTLEVSKAELEAASALTFTSAPDDISDANVFIVTTPTPIDEHKNPDMGMVLAATRTVAGAL